MSTVNSDGEDTTAAAMVPAKVLDDAYAKIADLEMQTAIMVNLLVVFARRAGGQTTVRRDELAAISGCMFQSTLLGDGSVFCTVRRELPQADGGG